MNRIVMILAAFAGAVVMGPPEAQTAPKPSAIPVSWEIEFDNLAPRAIMVQEGGDPKPKLFWYLKYTATNRNRDKAGKPLEVMFNPEFVLYTDTGQVLRAHSGILASVYDAIVKVENDPLLISPQGVAGKPLLFGADNAKTSVAIWPDFDPKAGQFDIFVGGLSGESRTVHLAQPMMEEVVDYKTGKTQQVPRNKVVLGKTLQLVYSVPGEAAARRHIEPQLLEKVWVMR